MPTRPFSDEKDVDDYESVVARFRSGRLNKDEFRNFRHLAGVYAQRETGRYMVRVRIPGGLLTADQADAIGRAAKTHSGGWTHITTRQNVQYYNMELDQTVALLRDLSAAGLTSRGASGNAVRNVVACPLAGVCPDEAFDARPSVVALTRRFLRRPEFEALPRKFKIGVSGCGKDCVGVRLQDFGAVAVEKDGEKGFRVYAGGGLGGQPRPGAPIAEFVSEKELPSFCEAVVKVFDLFGNRGVRARGRLKFLVEELGADVFARRVREALGNGAVPAPEIADGAPAEIPERPLGNDSLDYREWRRANALPQRQEGFSAVVVPVALGNIFSGQLQALAHAASRYGNGALRTTTDQNVVLPWVREELLAELHGFLGAVGLATRRRAVSVVSCPGAASCPSGLTNSRSLAQQLVWFPRGEAEVRVAVSGCSNSCGMHWVGDIGLSGRVKRVEGRDAPYYEVYVGGVAAGENVSLGTSLGLAPARQVPDVVARMIEFFRDARNPLESFTGFVGRLGAAALKDAARGAFESPAEFMDWGGTAPFTAKVMPSEC